MKRRLKICLFGPSGSGKSTAAEILAGILREREYSVEFNQVSWPAHETQRYLENRLGIVRRGQDPGLLQFICENYLPEMHARFRQQVAEWNVRPLLTSMAMINSDCRDNSYAELSKLEFTFVRVTCSLDIRMKRLIERDGATAETLKRLQWDDTAHMVPDDAIMNEGSIDQLRKELVGLANRL